MPEDNCSNDIDPFHWRTSISWKSVDKITCRGYDLNELAANVSFADMVYLLFRGELPTPAQGEMLNHIMITWIEHSFSPSTVTARLCAVGRPPVNSAIAAGIMTFGEAHGPGLTYSNTMIELLKDTRERGLSLKQAADEFVTDQLNRGLKIFGIHQPQHTNGDPRSSSVVERARELGVASEYTELQNCIQESLNQRKHLKLAPNLMGASGAVLLDLGFSANACFSIVSLARGFGNAAHATEEMERESPWRASRRHGMTDLLDLSLQGEQYYDGPPLRAVPTSGERGTASSQFDGTRKHSLKS